MTSNDFASKILKTSVSQICTVVGWTNAHVSALDLLTEITRRFICETGQHVHRYSELFGRTQPTLDDLLLAFDDMEVSIPDLEEYVQSVYPIPPSHAVAAFPVPTQSQLNFMKPGSREVLTRPVHIQEYLPPMNPSLEEDQSAPENFDTETSVSVDISSTNSPTMKRPGEANESALSKRLRMYSDDEQKVREVTSVMMTTSGFISEAREGKLPESRLPAPFFDEEGIDVKPKKALPMKRIVEGVKKIEPVDTKKMKHESTDEASLPPPLKKPKEKRTPRQELRRASTHGDMVYPGKQVQTTPKEVKAKPVEPEKPPERYSKLHLFKKLLKGKEDKRNEEIDVESVEVKKEKLIEKSPSPLPVAHPPSPPPKSPSPLTPETPERKKKKRKEKIKSEEIVESDGELMEEVEEVPVKKWDPFVPPLPVATDVKELPSALKNIPAALLGIRPGGVRPIPPPMRVPSPIKERTPTPTLKSLTPSPVAESLMTSPISDTYLSDALSPSGRETPKKSKKEKKKKEKKFKSKDKEERMKEKEERMRLKEEKKLKKEEKRALKRLRDEQEAEAVLVEEKPEKLKEVDKVIDEDALPKLTFKLKSPSTCDAESPTPELPASPKISPKPSKKEKEKKEAREKEEKERKEAKEKEERLKKEAKDREEKLKKEVKEKEEKIKNEEKEKEDQLKKEAKEKEEREKREAREKEEARKEKEAQKEILVSKEEEKVIPPRKVKERKKSPAKIKKEEAVKRSPSPIKAVTPKPPPTPKAANIPKAVAKAKKPPPSPMPVDVEKKRGKPEKKKVDPEIKKVESEKKKVVPEKKKVEPEKKTIEKVPKTPKAKEPKKEKPSPKQAKGAAAKKKQEEALHFAESVGSYFDEEGNKIWICPTCGRQDDGTPMIGCDECDDWYHWVCVGIRVAPSESENWYCQRCLAKKKTAVPEKKKGKKKKVDQ
ncbi:transcription initiation factor TFIID subunit 3-like [Artemia franciscana]|uniref:PHD-type domain-containing protein n=1 Tax=Artemia franciscana TaxID=6661 RepID=A0AA88KVA2_ARTSF|nr:hypothetical protein QYM36_016918 [Artemia franciscana]KAK2704698.1 hypothetical protein QYM36_016918 [Artemia franciscana]